MLFKLLNIAIVLADTRRTTNTRPLSINILRERMLLKYAPIPNLLIKELVDIEPHHLRLLANAEVHAGDVLQDGKEDERNDEGISRDGANLSELFSNLYAVTVDAAGCLGDAVESGDPGLGEDTGADGADHAADAVELEDIHALVDADPFVEVGAEGADDGGDETDGAGDPGRHVAGCWCDADETGNGAAASSNDGELALVSDVIDEDPAEDTGRCGGVGVECSHHGPHRAVESRSTLAYVSTCVFETHCSPLVRWKGEEFLR